MWTKLADRVRMLPTCVASCHRPLAQGRTSYLACPRLHTFHGSPSLPFSTSLHPSLPLPLPPLYTPFPLLTLEVGPLNTASYRSGSAKLRSAFYPLVRSLPVRRSSSPHFTHGQTQRARSDFRPGRAGY